VTARRGSDGGVSAEFDAVLDAYHRAGHAFGRGDPAPMKSLWSRRDDVTLANPLGPPRRGWSDVEETMDRVAPLLRDAERLDCERISKYVTDDLAFVVEIERLPGLKIGGSDEATPTSLRVTTVFRREDGSWRIMHRHADPITSPRPPASMAQA
jgi:ketosteroid isomerase-like protein